MINIDLSCGGHGRIENPWRGDGFKRWFQKEVFRTIHQYCFQLQVELLRWSVLGRRLPVVSELFLPQQVTQASHAALLSCAVAEWSSHRFVVGFGWGVNYYWTPRKHILPIDTVQFASVIHAFVYIPPKTSLQGCLANSCGSSSVVRKPLNGHDFFTISGVSVASVSDYLCSPRNLSSALSPAWLDHCT